MKRIIFVLLLTLCFSVNVHAVEFEWLKETKTFSFFQKVNIPKSGWASNQGNRYCQSINKGPNAVFRTVVVPQSPNSTEVSSSLSLSYNPSFNVNYATVFMANTGSGDCAPGDQAFYECSGTCPIGWARTSAFSFTAPATYNITFYNWRHCNVRRGWMVLCYN